MMRLKYVVVCFLYSALMFSQQTPTSKQNSSAPTETNAKHAAHPDYLQEAAGSSIFIYDAATKPCDPPPENTTVFPLGSGFVVGITDKSVPSPAGTWRGWKFLMTAGHVVHNHSSIIVRLNKSDGSGFACFPIVLTSSGDAKNVFSLGDVPADVIAIALPLMAGTDPTVVGYSYILDSKAMASGEIKVGTNVFTVGYLFGYSGQKQNYPVTKFGKISIVNSESWYHNPEWNRYEQAYLVELQNIPGLSGAPVMVYGPEFNFNPFSFRELPPLVIGIIKGLLLAPVGGGLISQGQAAVEPGDHVRELMKKIADEFKAAGFNPALD